MPARTGTDGRGGRLRAVHATASASTSRATRNFMSRPTPARPPACALLIVPADLGRWATPIPAGPLWAHQRAASPPRLGFEKFSIYIPHPRHHWCGSWGSTTSAQVTAEVDMLAGCGPAAGHLLSTRGQLDGCAP